MIYFKGILRIPTQLVGRYTTPGRLEINTVPTTISLKTHDDNEFRLLRSTKYVFRHYGIDLALLHFPSKGNVRIE